MANFKDRAKLIDPSNLGKPPGEVVGGQVTPEPPAVVASPEGGMTPAQAWEAWMRMKARAADRTRPGGTDYQALLRTLSRQEDDTEARRALEDSEDEERRADEALRDFLEGP